MAKKMAKRKKSKNPKLDHELYFKHMIDRYGNQVNWVDVEMYLTYDEMMGYFGEKCEEYEPLCANCSNWVKWHKTGKAEVMFERKELLKLLSGE